MNSIRDHEALNDYDGLPAWGVGSSRHGTVNEHLLDVSKKATNYLLGHSDSKNSIELVLAAAAAGLAAETLLKWTVAQISPVLLAGARNPASALFLAGVPRGASMPLRKPAQLASITWAEAWEIVRQAHGPSTSKKSVEGLFETRNAAAHLGVVDHDDLRLSLRTLVSLVDELLARGGIRPEHFYEGQFAGVLDVARQEHADTVLASYEAAKARAWEQYRARFAGITTEQRMALFVQLEAKEDQLERPHQDQVLVACPVCGRRAVAEYDDVPINYEHGEGDELVVHIIGQLEALNCPICTLSLGPAEVEHVPGIPAQVDWGTQIYKTTSPPDWFDEAPDTPVDGQ